LGWVRPHQQRGGARHASAGRVVAMSAAAELEVLSTEHPAASSANGMRILWQLDGGMPEDPAPDRRVLAASLVRVLTAWRAAERQVAELVDDRVAASGREASILLDSIAGYRAEHGRIFDDIRRLVRGDEYGMDVREDVQAFTRGART
jgi:hypothetical protein